MNFVNNKKINYFQSISYYLAFLSFGMVISSLGPSIPSLVEATSTSIGKISFLFTTYNFGILIGSLIGGIIFDVFKGHFILGFSLLFTSILYSFIPMVNVYEYLIVLTLFIGIFLGIILVGGNTLTIWVNQEKVDVWMNGLHMFSGIGAFLSPLLISYFLHLNSSLKTSYMIISIYILFSAIFVLLLKSPEIRKMKNGKKSKKNYILPVFLISLMFLLYVGAESSFGGWIYVYTLDRYPSHNFISGIITSIFWGMLIIGRFINLILSSRFNMRVRNTLIMAFVGSIILLIFLNMQNINIVLYILLTMFTGLLMSTIFPSIMTYAEEIIGITGKINSVFFISTSIGAMLVPAIIGNSYDIYGKKSVMVVILLTLLLSFIFLLTILISVEKKIRNN